jgi:anaerobic selenocysteine-containing dehydrogenase
MSAPATSTNTHFRICPKGFALKVLHEDPDRLRQPLAAQHGRDTMALSYRNHARFSPVVLAVLAGRQGPERLTLPMHPRDAAALGL